MVSLWPHERKLTSLPCPWLFDSISGSTLGFPVLHCLPEFAQASVHWVGDAIQPSHPLLPPSPPALNLSQHQGLFQWVSSLHQVAKVLELNFSIRASNESSGLTDRSPCCPRDSKKSSPTPQFRNINSSGFSLLCGPTLTSAHDYWKKT